MGTTLFLTGATGHLGPHVLARLLGAENVDCVFVLIRGARGAADESFRIAMSAALALVEDRLWPGSPASRIAPVLGDVTSPGLGLSRDDTTTLTAEVQVIVHAAGDTRFGAPIERLRAVNVDGTRAVCEFATSCSRLTQILFVSTTCVAGRRTGSVPETIADSTAGFVNAYEQSKWEAEQVVVSSGLPARVARLSTCAGGHGTGYVHRPGALHHLFRWIDRGLIPMVPAAPAACIDVISTDVAAAWLVRAALGPPDGLDVCHVAAGREAIPVTDLLEFAAARVGAARARRRPHCPPVVVDPQTYDLFQQMVDVSGDLLFARVQEASRAVLPMLLYPKVFETGRAERCWGGRLPHPDWRAMLSRVLDVEEARLTPTGVGLEMSHV